MSPCTVDHRFDEDLLFITLYGSLLCLIARIFPFLLSIPEADPAVDTTCMMISIFAAIAQAILTCYFTKKEISPDKSLIRNILLFLAFVNFSFWFYDVRHPA